MADITGYLKIISEANNGENVRDAIINCMKAINDDAAVKCTSLVITSPDNVTYKPGAGKAFRSVTVNIDGSGSSDPDATRSFEELTITENTENQTFPPEGTTDVAYSKVHVEIDWDAVLKGNPSSLAEEATMTHTITDPVTGRKYWDPITDCDKEYVRRVWIGTDVGLPNYGGNGSGTGGIPGNKCSVVFWNGTVKPEVKVCETTGIIGSALSSYPGKSTDFPYGRDVIWEPNPFNIVTPTNSEGTIMNCYCVGYNESNYCKGETISDDWQTICSKRGRGYPVGSIKNLTLNGSPYDQTHGYGWVHGATLESATMDRSGGGTGHMTQVFEDRDIIGTTFKMVKISEGGDPGTGSTWMALSGGLSSNLYDAYHKLLEWHSYEQDNVTNMEMDYYKTSYIHQFLNKCLLPAFPNYLQQTIVGVTKYALGQSSTTLQDQHFNDPVENTITNCKLWIPSLGEFKTDPLFQEPEWEGYAQSQNYYDYIFEEQGPDYSTNAEAGGFSMADIYTACVTAGLSNIPFFRTMVFGRSSNHAAFVGLHVSQDLGYFTPWEYTASPNGMTWGYFLERFPLCFCL